MKFTIAILSFVMFLITSYLSISNVVYGDIVMFFVWLVPSFAWFVSFIVWLLCAIEDKK